MKPLALAILLQVTPISSFFCGIPPIPPTGCDVGDCVCDEDREHCHWEFICE